MILQLKALISIILPSFVAIICLLPPTPAVAYPYTPLNNKLRARAEPIFPTQPPSCPICAQNYGSIDSCAQAAPVLANVSMVGLMIGIGIGARGVFVDSFVRQIIFNPGAFVSVIECACTDTFQSGKYFS